MAASSVSWRAVAGAAREYGSQTARCIDDVRVEAGDLVVHDSVVLAGHDTMEHRSPQSAARWVDVDAFERSHPGLVLEQTGDPAPEFTTHAADQHTYACHDASR